MWLATVEGSIDRTGHLCGTIFAPVRNCGVSRVKGRYAERHKAFAADSIGDLVLQVDNTPVRLWRSRGRLALSLSDPSQE